MLPGNAVPLLNGSLMTVPGSRFEKSPLRQLASGTPGFTRSCTALPRAVSNEKKKNVLFLPLYRCGTRMGAPMVAPGLCETPALPADANGFRDTNFGVW